MASSKKRVRTCMYTAHGNIGASGPQASARTRPDEPAAAPTSDAMAGCAKAAP